MPQTTEYKLEFCTITHRDDGIVVVVIDEGIDLDINMANQMIGLANSVLHGAPFVLLSDRKNSYSLSFDAMSALANMPNLIALAIVIYSEKSQLLVETQNFFISTLKKRPVKIFTRKGSAIEWLKIELDKLTTKNTIKQTERQI